MENKNLKSLVWAPKPMIQYVDVDACREFEKSNNKRIIKTGK